MPIFTWLRNVLLPGLQLTFSGRRMYQVREVIKDLERCTIILDVVGHYGMYPPGDAGDKAYAEWVDDHAMDPFFDEVLARSYCVRVLMATGFHGAEVEIMSAARQGDIYVLQIRR